MTQENFGYIVLVLAVCVLICLVCAFTYLNARGRPGVKAYIFLSLASGVYAFGYAFELGSSQLSDIQFWINIEYIGIPVIPVFCLIMSLAYTGHDRFLKKNFVLGLCIIPVLTYLFFYTQSFHTFYYTSQSINTEGPFPVVKLGKGLWYWVFAIYSYVCIFGGILLLLAKKQSTFLFRMQAVSMSIGLFLPLLGDWIYQAGRSPAGIDLTPVMMSIGGIFHAWSLLSFRMFHLVPVARGKVFESMRDGVIVMDESDRVVDFNRAASEVFPAVNREIIGKHVDVVFEKVPELRNLLNLGHQEFDIQMGNDRTGMQHFHVRLAPIWDGSSKTIGKTMVINDITERMMLYENLRALANIDGLTQISNRVHFMDESKKVLESVKLEEGPISVIMFDIDQFKSINDNYGHETGDTVLKQIVDSCKEHFGQGEIFGRYGGEEFMICLPFVKPGQAVEMAERLRECIAVQVIAIDQSGVTQISTTASFGVSGTERVSPDLDLGLLVREADKALYLAKKNGRNRTECA